MDLECGNTNKAFMELKGLARKGMGDSVWRPWRGGKIHVMSNLLPNRPLSA
jgi:hypothetical protein